MHCNNKKLLKKLWGNCFSKVFFSTRNYFEFWRLDNINSPEAVVRTATLLKKKFWHRCFLMNIAKFLRTLFFTEHLQWLFLIVIWIVIWIFFIIFSGASNGDWTCTTIRKLSPEARTENYEIPFIVSGRFVVFSFLLHFGSLIWWKTYIYG